MGTKTNGYENQCQRCAKERNAELKNALAGQPGPLLARLRAKPKLADTEMKMEKVVFKKELPAAMKLKNQEN